MQGNRDINDTRGPFAFPISAAEFFDRGMTLRDYFAAAALTGLLAYTPEGASIEQEGSGQLDPDDAARNAYECADAMLDARRPKPAPLPPFSAPDDNPGGYDA